VMVSSTKAAYNLTVSNSASGSYALKVMTIVTVIFFPIVLLYQGWSFHVFRARVKAPPAGPDLQPPTAAAPAPQA
jgi:cytochrome bd-type quinol oxidase subunit 2